jgi:hypothetical protein
MFKITVGKYFYLWYIETGNGGTFMGWKIVRNRLLAVLILGVVLYLYLTPRPSKIEKYEVVLGESDDSFVPAIATIRTDYESWLRLTHDYYVESVLLPGNVLIKNDDGEFFDDIGKMYIRDSSANTWRVIIERNITNYPALEESFKGTGTGQGLYVASRNGGVYHYRECPSAKMIKPENRLEFDDVFEANLYGYENACQICLG